MEKWSTLSSKESICLLSLGSEVFDLQFYELSLFLWFTTKALFNEISDLLGRDNF
jgi:hypothetical protein